MADLNSDTDLRGTPEIQYFVQRVSDLSRGKMSVKVAYSVGGLAMNAEQQVVKDVADGSFDLGFTGTSVFDTLGVPNFEALSAPMLIDNYPLENAVIRSSLPAKMMAGLAKLDVTGLAVLGDEHAQAGRGAASHRESGRLAGHHVRHLLVEDRGCCRPRSGGKARPGIRDRPGSGPRPRRTAGFRPGSAGLPSQSKEQFAPYITANVNLWPRTVALFANPGRLAKLTTSQRRLVYSGGGRRRGPLDGPRPERRPGGQRHMPVGRTVCRRLSRRPAGPPA